MKERPILFSGEMVRAILDGRKTQTRRPVKSLRHPYGHLLGPEGVAREFIGKTESVRCPIGQPGDRLWVRETWQFCDYDGPGGYPTTDAVYRADGETDDKRKGWRPSIHMPRWASRITLEIVHVRVERVGEITRGDAMAEGCCGGHGSIPGYAFSATPREHFRHLWQSIYGTWDANPWVWAVEFRRTK